MNAPLLHGKKAQHGHSGITTQCTSLQARPAHDTQLTRQWGKPLLFAKQHSQSPIQLGGGKQRATRMAPPQQPRTSAHKEAKAVAVAGQRVVRALAAEGLTKRVHAHGAHAPLTAIRTTRKGLPRVGVSSPGGWSPRHASRIVLRTLPRVAITPCTAHAPRRARRTLKRACPRVRVSTCGPETRCGGLRSAQRGLLAKVREACGRRSVGPRKHLQRGYP